jgi:hypothetical protein
MSFRESSVIAALMNTRGLVELIVLNLGTYNSALAAFVLIRFCRDLIAQLFFLDVFVGVNAGILSRKTFSVMVIMCLVTTFMVRYSMLK